METFAKLFECFLVFVYPCFDRIVIQGYLPLLTRPEHIVHFFRDVHGLYPITPQVLAQRTGEYRGWVQGYARNHKIPVMKAEKGVSQEDGVRPHLQRIWSVGSNTGSTASSPAWRWAARFAHRCPSFRPRIRTTALSGASPPAFCITTSTFSDPVIGPLAMCVGTYLPFQTTYYLNGHNFMEIELRRQGVAFRKDDNAFLSTSDPKALQEAADKLSASILEKRLNYWSWLLAPKFSEKDRKAVNLRRDYSINQIEYCRNFIFQRNFPIHKIFERSCEMGLFRLAADKVAHIFGVRITKRLRGKLHSVLEKLDHGHHVLRVYCKNLVGRMYEKFSTFLRVEVCVNRMKDLGLNKGLKNLECLRQKLVDITDRFAGFEAQSLNVHVDFPLFQKIALPIASGKTKIAGIQFGLPADRYTLTQLRYDVRKMKAHGLLERNAGRYLYRLTDKGTKAALMFVLFHQRVCGPLANSLFHHRPDEIIKPTSKIEAAYHKADHAIQQVLDQLAA